MLRYKLLKQIFLLIRLYKQYVIYIILSFFLLISVSIYLSIDRLEKDTQQEIIQLNKRKSELSKLKIYASKLDSFVKEKNIKKINKREAYKVLTKRVDDFVQIYGAKVETNLVEEPGRLFLTLKITGNLDSNILELLKSMHYSFLPVYQFGSWSIDKKNNTVQITVQLIQPFSEEENES